MKNAKHTPGPWSVFDDGGETYGIIRYADGTPISTQDGCSMNGEVFICDLAIKNEADAALIAAAPDLLAALEALEARALEMRKLIDPKTWAELEDMATVEIINARAALALAKGE